MSEQDNLMDESSAKVDLEALISSSPDHFLAVSKTATPFDIIRLSHHPEPDVRILIASRETTPVYLLELLANDREPRVRRAVATNHRAPLSTLEHLALDDNILLRFGLIEELEISQDILRALESHRNPYIRRQAYLARERRMMEAMLVRAGFEAKPDDRFRLGDILLESENIIHGDLEEAATMAHAHGLPLGQAIVQAGLLMKEIVVSNLLKQALLRQA